MRHRLRTALAVAVVAGALLWGAPASAAVPGFEVAIGESPGAFAIGEARTLTAVASTDQGRLCRKVRWSLQLRTEGVSLDQVRISRIENGRSFRVRTELTEDGARVLDAQLDPGQLCQGRTVTGRWDIAFTGPDDGTVTFQASALDAGGRELNSADLQSRVVSPVAAAPSSPAPSPSSSPSPTPSPSETAPEPEPEAETEPADGAAADDEPSSAAALDPASGTTSVLLPGLIIGAVLVFLGVGLLLRIRTRNRRDPVAQAEVAGMPTGFYTMPRE